MLGLMGLISVSLMIPSSKWSWYQKLWSLCLVSVISLVHIYSPFWGYDFINHLVACDLMSSILICLVFWIFLLMILASQNSVKLSYNKSSSFLNVLLLLSLILVGTFMCSSSIGFYFLFESSLIPTLLLILGWGYQPERLQSGMYMMIYTVGASLPLLLSVLWLYLTLNSSDMLMMNILRKQVLSDSSWWAMDYLSLVIFMAFLVKLPMFTVHLWLPKAHVEAPVSGSMVLAAILLKLGGYGIFRFYQYINFYSSSWSIIFFSLALWGGVLSSVICFRQVDFKALIAYSSVGHMSLMVGGVFSNTSWGWSGALILMISHGFCSSALFALANYTYEKTHSRSLIFNKGMLMLAPSVALWWFLFCVMNMAGPPSINLLGEIMIFPCVMFSSGFYLVFLGLMSFFSALYSMYLYTCIHHGGNPRFSKPFGNISILFYSVMVLHWVPGNLLIMKSDIMLW